MNRSRGRELLSVTLSAPIYLASQGGEFGYSVAADGNLAVVGAPGNDRAYVYDLTSSQQPIPYMTELTDSSVPTGSRFGSSVAISGTKVVVGAPNQTVDSHATPKRPTFSTGVSTTLTYQASWSWWTSSTTFVIRFDVADADVVVLDILVTVKGAHDYEIYAGVQAIGNLQEEYVSAALFNIDTLDPP